MTRAPRVCSVPGCPQLTTAGRCPDHRRQADQARGTSADRGYRSAGHQAFRAAVLTRDPLCVLCPNPSTVADHYPLSRRQLVAQQQDPNDPQHGRGMCAPCHGRETAQHQPGGWNTPR